jgi:hypothetical protein
VTRLAAALFLGAFTATLILLTTLYRRGPAL